MCQLLCARPYVVVIYYHKNTRSQCEDAGTTDEYLTVTSSLFAYLIAALYALSLTVAGSECFVTPLRHIHVNKRAVSARLFLIL